MRVKIFGGVSGDGRVHQFCEAHSKLGNFIIPTFGDSATARDKRNLKYKGYTIKNWSEQRIKDFIKDTKKYSWKKYE